MRVSVSGVSVMGFRWYDYGVRGYGLFRCEDRGLRSRFRMRVYSDMVRVQGLGVGCDCQGVGFGCIM